MDVFVVYCQVCSVCGGYYVLVGFLFELYQCFGVDGFDFWDDQVWLFLGNQCVQCYCIEYVDYMCVMCYLYCWGIGIVVGGDYFYFQLLQFDGDFFVQFV